MIASCSPAGMVCFTRLLPVFAGPKNRAGSTPLLSACSRPPCSRSNATWGGSVSTTSSARMCECATPLTCSSSQSTPRNCALSKPRLASVNRMPARESSEGCPRCAIVLGSSRSGCTREAPGHRGAGPPREVAPCGAACTRAARGTSPRPCPRISRPLRPRCSTRLRTCG